MIDADSTKLADKLWRVYNSEANVELVDEAVREAVVYLRSLPDQVAALEAEHHQLQAERLKGLIEWSVLNKRIALAEAESTALRQQLKVLIEQWRQAPDPHQRTESFSPWQIRLFCASELERALADPLPERKETV